MALRILIDLQGAQCGSRSRGIGRYSLALARGIARNAGLHRVFILLNGLFPDTIDDIRSAFAGVLEADRFLIFDSPGPVAEVALTDNSWRRHTAEIQREHVINLLSPDVVLITSMVEGAQDDTVISVGSIPSTVPVAAVIYDLIPMLDPAKYLGSPQARQWYMSKVDSLCRSDLLLGISQSTTNDAIRLLKIAPNRIRNISSAADTSFTALRADTPLLDLAKRFDIQRKFVMHSSAYEPRKNFEGLIRAFSLLPKVVRTQFQLVLVCKLDEAGRAALEALGKEVGLSKRELILTGFVTDKELISLYSACHLFVFPSLQEGFGLPALEAMSCGAPTIGSDVASVPEVIGRADALFDPGDVSSISALMKKALTEPAFYSSLKIHARVQSAKFSWDSTARRALEAIEHLVEEQQPSDQRLNNPVGRRSAFFEALAEASRDHVPTADQLASLALSIECNENEVRRLQANAAFCGPLSWRIEGPFDSTYSLALLNRETARALAALGHNVSLHSTEGPGDFEPNAVFLSANPDISLMFERSRVNARQAVDVVSRNLYPPRVADMSGRRNLLHHYAWEESGFPLVWVNDFNAHLDGMTCLSSHVEKTLLDSGVSVPMSTSGCGVDHWERIVASPNYKIDASGFRFLHVSSCFPRKGVDILLDAYGRAFSQFDDVSLIIKTFPNPHNEIHSMLAERRARFPKYPTVLIVEGDLSDSDLKALYQQCHALVAPSRAEGFGLPMAEAMLSGLPVITTGWSGQLDFCNETTAWLVDFDFEPAKSHFSLFNSVWAGPNVDSLASTLTEVFNASPAERQRKSSTGRDHLLQFFKWSDVAARLVTHANSIAHETGDSGISKIGWITTWNTRCGIASYSEHLLEHFPESVTVLAPHDLGKLRKDEQNCVRCWHSRKERNGFDELSACIVRLGLQTLVVHFNYGFFNFRDFCTFIEEQANAGRNLIVIMHATADPAELPGWNWSLKEILPSLARCQRLLVHSTADLNRLKKLGLIENVSLFPHGVLLQPEEHVAIRQPSKLPLIATFGYCLPHKGLLELVHAVDAVRKRGLQLRLRLLNAQYPAPVSDELANKLRQKIAELDLEDHVETYHEYLSDEQSLKLLREAELIVFPYQKTNESASGAVRFGLASGRPVAVTPIPIFQDLGFTVHRLPGVGVDDIAAGIVEILEALKTNDRAMEVVASNAAQWRSAHGYPVLAHRLHAICAALSRRSSSYSRIFDGSSGQFRSQVGRIYGRSLVSTGVPGHLLYGPYLALSAGTFRVTINGSFSVPVGSVVESDVCIAGGSEVLSTDTLSGSIETNAINLTFTLTRRCVDLEIRVSVDAAASVLVRSIEIQQLHEVASASTLADLPLTRSRENLQRQR